MKTTHALALVAAVLAGMYLFGKKGDVTSSGAGGGFSGGGSQDEAVKVQDSGAKQSTTTETTNNADIINASIAQREKTSGGGYVPQGGFDTGKRTSSGNVLIGYAGSNVSVIPNKIGKNYANLGAGTDPSKW